MRMSCNGCRVLRKGCSENCSIRPCLEWIKSPDSQANATVFLAKFYGRAGLINLLNAGPPHLRSAVFKSLLYESCGRIVNPIHGSAGLLWSGQWHLCQNAVDAVLNGNPIIPIRSDATTGSPTIQGCDIRHITKEENSRSHSTHLNRIKTSQTRFKRSRVLRPKPLKETINAIEMLANASEFITRVDDPELNGSSTSHDSTVSHPDESTVDTMLSFETSKPAETCIEEKENDGDLGLELDLTLGFGFSSVKSGLVG